MKIEVSELPDNINCIRLDGRMDASGVDLIEMRFSSVVVSSGRNAVVDLSGVSFIASMGIRMLIATARAVRFKQTKMVLFGAPGAVQAVLDTVALDQIVPITSNQQLAIERVRAP